MIRALGILWFATLGMDRVDLLGGRSDFLLTPFLVLSPLLILLLLARYSRERTVARDLPLSLLACALAFLSLCLLSSLFSNDFDLSLRRFLLLSYQLGSVGLVAYLARLPWRLDILKAGTVLGLGLHGLFAGLELQSWLQGRFIGQETFSGYVNLLAHTLGPYAPRLSGVPLDANRGGLYLVVYSFILLMLPPFRFKRLLLTLSVLFLMLTFSRTAVMAYLVMGTAFLLWKYRPLSRRLHRTLLKGFVGLVLATPLLSLAVLYSPLASTIDLQNLVQERLRTDEGSSGGEHLLLIARGLETAVSDLKHVLVGIGFGAAHTVLQDIFPNNKYANFHSIYVSMMAEVGFFGLVAFMLLYLLPLLRGSPYLPILLATMVFNLFYQLVFDPVFWLVVMLGWLSTTQRLRAPRLVPHRAAPQPPLRTQSLEPQ